MELYTIVRTYLYRNRRCLQIEADHGMPQDRYGDILTMCPPNPLDEPDFT